MGKLFTIFGVVGLLISAVVPVMAAVQYTVEPLGKFYPMAMNNNGDVVGNISTSTYSIAVLYSKDKLTGQGKLTELGTFGGLGSYASDINDKGQIVGNYMLADKTYHAFVYSDGTMTDLGALGGLSSFADGINNSGQIVGSINTGGIDYSAFLLNGIGGTPIDLGKLSGSRVFPADINSSGQIVGSASIDQKGTAHSFLYENSGTLSDIGTFGGYSMASAINDNGQIVGESATTNGIVHAFLYKNEEMIDIDVSNLGSVARDINNNGEIVGALIYTNHAFGYYYDDELVDLNTLINSDIGVTLCEGIGINNVGQIIVGGFYNNDLSAGAFLLTPIPEPSAFIHIIILFTGVITFLRRRRNIYVGLI